MGLMTDNMYKVLSALAKAGDEGLPTEGDGRVSGRTLRALRELSYAKPRELGVPIWVATPEGRERARTRDLTQDTARRMVAAARKPL